ncbi:MAG: hypothetical protein JSS02_28550 [Planctomycetes bacterium]|nr:hypothetical protein [Planctomycetota bacterium]
MDDWPTELERLVCQLQEDGPRRYAGWRDDVFMVIVCGPAKGMWARMAHAEPNDPAAAQRTMADYLRLVHEAVGLGYIRQADRATTFLDECLRFFIPFHLPQVESSLRGSVLAKVWNLAEGLAREPWLSEYVRIRLRSEIDLMRIEKQIEALLVPVLSPTRPAVWAGTYRILMLNLRDECEEFLPGEIYLAAPAVVCVRDRRHSTCLGILLQRNGATELLGEIDALPAYSDDTAAPLVEFTENAATIAGRRVELPCLGRPHTWVAAPTAGFVIASAVDSQRLWIVEAA